MALLIVVICTILFLKLDPVSRKQEPLRQELVSLLLAIIMFWLSNAFDAEELHTFKSLKINCPNTTYYSFMRLNFNK